jgi:hypothetical protein
MKMMAMTKEPNVAMENRTPEIELVPRKSVAMFNLKL